MRGYIIKFLRNIRYFKFFSHSFQLTIKFVLWISAKFIFSPFLIFFPKIYFFITRKISQSMSINNTLHLPYGKFYCRNFYDFWIISPNFEEEVLRYLKISKNEIFIDIGAHIGKYSVIAAKKCKNVISIEPEKNNFEILKKNVTLNSLKNVILLNCACSDKKGYLKLYISETTGGHSLERKGKTYQIVETRTLDEILKTYKINSQQIGLIKIDVEGHELKVLKGSKNILKKSKNLRIIFESWENFNEVKKFLRKFDFQVKEIYPGYYYAWKIN